MTSDDLEVFWISGSPYSWRVLLTLELKQRPYTSRLLEASKQEHRTPEFLALNPRGRTPVLRHGKTVLYESLAIMAYLDRLYPSPRLFPESAVELGQVWRRISEFFSYASEPFNRIVLPIFFNKVGERESDIRAAVPVVHDELGRWEQNLGSARWMNGADISAIDVAVYPFFKALLRAASKPAAASLALDLLPFARRYPKLSAWLERVEGIPGYERTYPPHWRS